MSRNEARPGFLHYSRLGSYQPLWWTVNEFDISLPRQPFFNNTTIVNGGGILLELDKGKTGKVAPLGDDAPP
jgi:hypothetical protein